MIKKFTPVLIHVNPHKLDQHTFEPHLWWVVWAAQNLPGGFNRRITFRLKWLLGYAGIFGGNWDLRSQSFTNRIEYIFIHDLFEKLPFYRSSQWYIDAREQLVSSGEFSHKSFQVNSVEQLDELFEKYLIELIASMQSKGYNHEHGADYPQGMIGRNGELIKTAHGTHRLAAAKATNAPGLFPIQVCGVHRLWFNDMKRRFGEDASRDLGKAIQEIEINYR